MLGAVQVLVSVTLAVTLQCADSMDPELDPRFLRWRAERDRLKEVHPAEFYRLPADLIPEAYLIFIEVPDLGPSDRPPFNGVVDMWVRAVRSTKNILVHGLDITLKEDNVTVRGGDTTSSRIPVHNIEYDLTREMFNITLLEDLKEGETYMVHLPYRAILADWMAGFYKTSYELNNTTRYLIASQLQATQARMAFPCMDEPHLKPHNGIQMTVSHFPGYTALSNMPVNSTTQSGGRIIVTFDRTPPMSTYLVALVVSDLVGTVIEESPFQQSVWCRSDARDRGADMFSKLMVPQVLKQMEYFTEMTFHLPKLHHIAVPNKGGAMENWGLITYAEDYLLVERNSSASAIQGVLTVIAHETAHQWFGNLVSPHLWDYTWLSEGFAAFLEYYIADKVEPEWHIMDQFTGPRTQAALAADDSPGAFPLTQSVGSAAEILAHFGRITYNKGASIVRMTQHILGEEIFLEGIRRYLRWNERGTGKPDSLFRSWQEASNDANVTANVAGVLTNYTTTIGYPIIYVSRNYDRGTASFIQRPNPMVSEDSRWWVPISAAWRDGPLWSTSPIGWLPPWKPTQGEKDLTLDLSYNNKTLEANSWLLINPQQTGYYRVSYDKTNWLLLSRALREESRSGTAGSLPFPSQSRAMLLDDSWSLWKIGKETGDVALELTEYLVGERDVVPWRVAQKHFKWLIQLTENSEIGPSVQNKVLHLLSPWYESLGFDVGDDQDHVTRLSHEVALPWACELGHPDCVRDVLGSFKDWLFHRTFTVPDYAQETMMCVAVRDGGRAGLNFVLAQLKNETVRANTKLRGRLVAALGCLKAPVPLRKLFMKALGLKPEVSMPSYTELSSAVISALNPVGVQVAWDVIFSRYDIIINRTGESNLVSTLSSISKVLCNEQDVLQMDELYTLLTDAGMTAVAEAVEKAAKQVMQNVLTINRNRKHLEAWMKIQSSGVNIPSLSPYLYSAVILMFFWFK